MICQRCLLRLSRRTTSSPSTAQRAFSQSTTSRSIPVTAQTTTATNPRPHGAPAATSLPGIAQPFSTPLTLKPTRERGLPTKGDLPPTKQTKAAAKLPASSMPAGTPLKGLNFMKNKQDPVAGEDTEYPPWLWRVLAEKQGSADAQGPSEGDLFAKSKKQRQRAAKALRKQQLLHPEALAPKIPIYEQSVDLPAGEGSVEAALDAKEARGELQKAMREKRRKGIKEQNFLKAMKA